MRTGRGWRAAVAAGVVLAGVAAPDAVRAAPGQAGAPARIEVTRIPVPEGYRAAGDLTGSRTFIEAGWVVFEAYRDDPERVSPRLVVHDPRGRTHIIPEPAEEAEDVSRRGHVVGTTEGFSSPTACAADPPCRQPFLWSGGRFTILPTGGPYGSAAGVNDRGQVAGWIGRPDSPSPVGGTAVVWDGDRTLVLDDARISSAVGINNRGQVAVNFGTYLGPNPDYRAAVWSPGGGVTELGTLGGDWSWARGINERGEVYGVSATADGTTHAFLWRDGEMIDLGTLGGEATAAVALNDRGHVTGRSQTADGVWQAYLWRDGEMTTLAPGTGYSTPEAINNRDEAVGTIDEGLRDFMWRDGELIDLEDAVIDEGYDRVVVADIDDQGRIVASATSQPDPTPRTIDHVLLLRVR